jgi:peptidoglycan hydrolase-like protein with peptidoglycan-binding domain
VLGKRRPGQGAETTTQPKHSAAAPQESDVPPQDSAAAILANQGGEPSWRRSGAASAGLVVAAIALVAIVAGVSGLALLANSHSKASTAASAKSKLSLSGSQLPAVPLRVVSLTPAVGSASVSGSEPVQIVFSAPLALHPPMPAFTPPAHGQWQVSGTSLTFIPATPFAPSTRYVLRIPAGLAGLRSTAGRLLAASAQVRFRTGSYSQLRLAQLLDQLGYLPMSWQPDETGRLIGGSPAGGLANQEALAFNPPPGSFGWNRGYPATLQAQWQPGQANPLIRGAMMAFQAQRHLTVTGVTGPKFWHALFVAAARQLRNRLGYTYAIASKGSPETLTIWHDGRVVLHSLANTGIAVAPTAAGTYPVYLRYRFQIMSGTNPDGSHYADPVSFVSYFNGGDAVHYFPRGSYGFPQSLGCVELPYAQARRAWPYLTYGSLVTVTG